MSWQESQETQVDIETERWTGGNNLVLLRKIEYRVLKFIVF